jgi:hypothetical protein
MAEPLEMTWQERLTICAFASKSAEMLEDGLTAARHPTNMQQWQALAFEARKVLKRLDADNPTLLPLPHDGVSWKDRA